MASSPIQVKEMFAIPKELYFHIMGKATSDQKRILGDVNVDQVNVSCGPLFAGHKSGKFSQEDTISESEENKIARTKNRAKKISPLPEAPPQYVNSTLANGSNITTSVPTSTPTPTPTLSTAPPPATSTLAPPPPLNTSASSEKQKSTTNVTSRKKRKLNPVSLAFTQDATAPATLTPAAAAATSALSATDAVPKDPSNVPANIEINKPSSNTAPIFSFTPDTPPSRNLFSLYNSEKSKNDEFRGVRPFKASSALEEVNKEIMKSAKKSARKSGNFQEIDELEKSALSAGLSSSVKKLAKSFENDATQSSTSPEKVDSLASPPMIPPPVPPQSSQAKTANKKKKSPSKGPSTIATKKGLANRSSSSSNLNVVKLTRAGASVLEKKKRDEMRKKGIAVVSPPKKPLPQYNFG